MSGNDSNNNYIPCLDDEWGQYLICQMNKCHHTCLGFFLYTWLQLSPNIGWQCFQLSLTVWNFVQEFHLVWPYLATLGLSLGADARSLDGWAEHLFTSIPLQEEKTSTLNLSESGKIPSSLAFQIMTLLPFRKVLSVGWLFEFPKMSRFVVPQMSTCYWFSARIFHQFFTLCKRNLLCWCGINLLL